MTLNEWAARKKIAILERLKQKRPPEEGQYDEGIFREGIVKGEAQAGTTRYEPDRVHFEFIFPDPESAATVLCVTLKPPERIVHLPVPEWVIESVWQGEVSGSYQFESQAKEMVERFNAQLEPEANRGLFGARSPTGRG
ncbi:MAG: hypothetical protein IH851_01450 [Armatimonadetes bacterium]|nr:hypothetical protein [Armatimonadota bacterium]